MSLSERFYDFKVDLAFINQQLVLDHYETIQFVFASKSVEFAYLNICTIQNALAYKLCGTMILN